MKNIRNSQKKFCTGQCFDKYLEDTSCFVVKLHLGI